MTVKEHLESIIKSYADTLKMSLEQIESHVQEEEKLLRMVKRCQERTKEIDAEILENGKQIKKLKKILEKL